MKTTVFLIASATALLLACGKAEEAAVAQAPQAEPAPVALPVETPPVLQAAAAPKPEDTPAVEAAPAPQPATAPAPRPATPSKPAAAQPADEAAASATKSDPAHGQQVYRQACAFCHDKGVAGAPKAGDAAAWGPRLAQGIDTLYASALQGKGAMPARGGNPALADTDVKAAVDHLAAQSR